MSQVIWILREQRSGGTWFVKKLCEKIKRTSCFFDLLPEFTNLSYINRKHYFIERQQHLDDTEKILNTHDFFATRGLANYTDPCIIRLSRRNKTEQFLSHYLINFSLIPHNLTYQKSLQSFPKLNKIMVSKSEIDKFIKLQNKNDWLWSFATVSYPTEVIYYEDLLDGYNSKLLELDFCMSHKQHDLPVKLPYDKKEVFVNYHLIEKYLTEKLMAR